MNPLTRVIRSKPLSSIYTIREFRAIIDRERERADRYGQRFSLAVFEVRTTDENSIVVRRLVRTLYRRFRNIDELGWYARGQIGIILPYTPAKGAWKLAEDVCELISTIVSPPPFTIYTYPSLNWPGGLSVRFRTVFDVLFTFTRGKSRQPVLTGDEFRSIIELERERADRNGHSFSMVLFDMEHLAEHGLNPRDFVHKLDLRLRETDEIGSFDSHQIGVILPYATAEEARGMTNSLCTDPILGLATKFTIFTYPDNWLPEDRQSVQSITLTPTTCVEDRAMPGVTDRRNPPDDRRRPPEQGTVKRAETTIHAFFVRPIPSWKRTIDVLGSLTGIMLFSPVLLGVAGAIKLLSPGPVLFSQPRAGLGGKPFNIHKFRSMVPDAESRKDELRQFNERTGPAFKMTDDPRITSIGRFIRKWSLDELPQLFNVLRGDMSLVGPRPLPVSEDEGVDQWHMVRRYIRPGITCLWQISARHKSDFDDWVRLDIEYARNQTLWLDLKILFLTVPAVLLRRGAR